MTNFHQMSLRGDMGFNYTNPKQQQQKQLTTTTSNNSIIIAGLNNPASSQQKETSILQHSQVRNSVFKLFLQVSKSQYIFSI